jgi:hypothetical protein
MKNRNPDNNVRLRNSDKDREGRKMHPGTPAYQNMKKDVTSNKNRSQKDKDSDIEDLANDVNGTVGSRQTGTSNEDIAGVADIDRGLKR